MKNTPQRVTYWLVVASVAILGALAVARVVGFVVLEGEMRRATQTVAMSNLVGRQRALGEAAVSYANETSPDSSLFRNTLDELAANQQRLKQSPEISGSSHQLVSQLDLPIAHMITACNEILSAQDAQDAQRLDGIRIELRNNQQEFDKQIKKVDDALAEESLQRLEHSQATEVWLLVVSIVFIGFAAALVAGPLNSRLRSALRLIEEARTSAEERAEELEVLRGQLEAANNELKERHIKLRTAYDETASNNQFLKMASARFEDLFHGVPFACFSVDAEGTVFEWNESATKMFGVSGHETIQRTIFGRFFSLDNDFLLKGLIAEAFKGNHLANIELEAKTPAGLRQLLVSVFPMRAARQEPTAALIACADITQQKFAERAAKTANERVGAILESIKDAFVTFDRNLVYHYVNHTAAEWLGLDASEVIGRSAVEVSPSLRGSKFLKRIEEVLQSGESEIFDQYFEAQDAWFEFRVYRSEIGVSVFYNDITDRKRAEETIRAQQEQLEVAMLQLSESSVQLEQNKLELEAANRNLQELATTDGLTGLLNHRAMQDELIVAVKKSATWGVPVSVALLDVDHFKKFNDTFGHQAGDVVLRQLAQYLRGSVRHGDIVARYGGEEFCVILPETNEVEAAIVCERIRQQVEGAVWENRNVTVSVGFSTGVGVRDPQSLIKQADHALYEAKAAGRNRVCQYRPDQARCA